MEVYIFGIYVFGIDDLWGLVYFCLFIWVCWSNFIDDKINWRFCYSNVLLVFILLLLVEELSKLFLVFGVCLIIVFFFVFFRSLFIKLFEGILREFIDILFRKFYLLLWVWLDVLGDFFVFMVKVVLFLFDDMFLYCLLSIYIDLCVFL